MNYLKVIVALGVAFVSHTSFAQDRPPVHVVSFEWAKALSACDPTEELRGKHLMFGMLGIAAATADQKLVSGKNVTEYLEKIEAVRTCEAARELLVLTEPLEPFNTLNFEEFITTPEGQKKLQTYINVAKRSFEK